MAWAFVNAARGAGCSVCDSVECLRPTDTAQNDIMFAWVGRYASGAIATPPSGWTKAEEQLNAYYEYLYWKVAGAAEPSAYTWTFTTATRSGVYIFSFRDGFNTADPIEDSSAVYYTTSNTTVRAASVTAAAADSPCVWIASMNYQATEVTFTPPTDFTDHYDGGHTTEDMWVCCASKLVATGATGDLDGTLSETATTKKNAFAVALNPPADGCPKMSMHLARMRNE